ncbi:hypothetical protein Landi51_09763 [Colletotrichum acutatum]
MVPKKSSRWKYLQDETSAAGPAYSVQPETETNLALDNPDRQTAVQENVRPTRSTSTDHRQVSSCIYPIRRQICPSIVADFTAEQKLESIPVLEPRAFNQLRWGLYNQRGLNTNPLNAIAAVLDSISGTQSFTTTKQIDTLVLESI